MEKIKFRLQGHEKFILRDGWLYKGLHEVLNSKSLFLRPDAPDMLGIGSNMVKSLRYWLRAFKLIEDSPQGATITELGKMILNYDPYLMDLSTVWILHSNLVKNSSEATSWYLFFNYCNAFNSTKTDIESLLNKELAAFTAGASFSEKSLSNDIDLLLSMYSKTRRNEDPEEKNTSVFSQLHLIKQAEGVYSKTSPDLRTLNEWVLFYELAGHGSESISIDDFVNGVNGVKAIYQISEIAVIELLEKLESANLITLNRTAGLDMIYIIKNLSQMEVLKEYYDTRSR